MEQTQETEPKRGEAEKEALFSASAWDCGSPLYDSFELASFSHVLESHLMALPFAVAASAGADEAPARVQGGRGRKGAAPAKKRSRAVLRAIYAAVTFRRKS